MANPLHAAVVENYRLIWQVCFNDLVSTADEYRRARWAKKLETDLATAALRLAAVEAGHEPALVEPATGAAFAYGQRGAALYVVARQYAHAERYGRASQIEACRRRLLAEALALE